MDGSPWWFGNPDLTVVSARKRRVILNIRYEDVKMIKQYKPILLFVIVFLSCAKEVSEPSYTEDLLDKLQALTGVTAIEIAATAGFERTFEIDILQPVDHQNPNGPQFHQRLYLNHINETAPMVFAPSGYTSNATYREEITPLLNANQIKVTHRYFIGAQPQPLDWQYCTIQQSANDHHRIVTLFKTIYTGIWVNSGRSKNGMTAFFHRRYYPDDVMATLAYVAPLPFDTADVRFDQFLETIGTEENRNTIKQFQRTVLKRRGDIIPLVQNHLDGMGLHYSIGLDAILEYAVYEYPFAFWQAGPGDCSEIPDTLASAQTLYSHLELRSGTSLFCDEIHQFYQPLWYQAYTQFGYYRLITEHLSDLLEAVSSPSYSRFAPPGVVLNFDPQISQNILNWIQNEGNNIIFIYGGQDPWSAAAVELTGQTNALKIVQPGANHSVRISDLDNSQIVHNTLEAWLGVQIDLTKAIHIPTWDREISWYMKLENLKIRESF